MIFKPHGLVFVIFLLASFCTAHQHHPLTHDESCASNPHGDSSSILLVGCLSAIVFCFVGILPSYFIKNDTDEQKFVNSEVFKCLLAFAAGSLLADIFLHLIPEVTLGRSEHEIKRIGLISIAAFVIFLIIEKTTELIPNAHALGTLNLIANFLDNSAHGTSVVGAFQNSLKFGLVALLATVIHEVPHEFSDFALLLKDGYTRKSAVMAQLITAFSGTISATLVYALSSTQAHFERCSNLNTATAHSDLYKSSSQDNNFTSSHSGASSGSTKSDLPFILPFTIGGFLYIALVGIIPDLIKEEDTRVSCKQLVSFLVGIIFIFSLGEIELLLPYLIGDSSGTSVEL